ncbi:MAG: type II toxin-antitoxin system HicB family antitoxin [archaeon]
MKYSILVSKDEDNWITVECLNLHGCISQGKTIKQAINNIKDAIKGHLESVKKHQRS